MNALILAAVMAAVGVWAVVHSLRGCRHLPAAADNKPGTNTTDLSTCRQILRETKARKERKP